MTTMKLIVIDNYDSFTYNIVHMLREMGIEPDVARNDMISVETIGAYDKIIVSPGPGVPAEAGIVPEVLRRYGPTHGILGVCLGHQAIGECYGASLKCLDEVYHGVHTPVDIVVDDEPLFKGVPRRIEVGRYHSWVVDPVTLPDCLEVTAMSPDGNIMALRHRRHDVHGVQFHPESVMTPEGKTIIRNFVER